MPELPVSSELIPIGIAVVASEDGQGFQLSISRASAEGAHEMTLLAERFTSRESAARHARDNYPKVPMQAQARV